MSTENKCPHCGAEYSGGYGYICGTVGMQTSEACDHAATLRQQLADAQLIIAEQNEIISNGKAANREQALKVDELGRLLAEAKREAEGLCRGMAKDWKLRHPEFDLEAWGLCDSVAGVITQIDNMYAGIRNELVEAKRQLAEEKAKRVNAVENWKHSVNAVESLCLTVKGHHTCAYCGWVGKGNLNINQSRDAVIEHVKTCDKHPLQAEILTLRARLEAAEARAENAEKDRDGIIANIGPCGACAEGLLCGSHQHPHSSDCVYSRLEAAEAERDQAIKTRNEIELKAADALVHASTLTNLLRRAKEFVLNSAAKDCVPSCETRECRHDRARELQIEITAALEGKPAGRDAEALLKEAVAILDDFQGYYCAEDSCPTVDEAYHNAAAFVAKIKGVNLEV